LVDNYYEALFNNISNDLFGFSIVYYNINGVEFIFIGLLLLIDTMIDDNDNCRMLAGETQIDKETIFYLSTTASS
jgi:hypothetical protein